MSLIRRVLLVAKHPVTAIILLLMAVAMVAPAYPAPPIFTPPVQVFSESSHTVTCGVVNVHNKTRTVTIDLLDQSAKVVFTQTKAFGPGQAGGLIVGVDPMLTPVVYCRFTVVGGAKGNIRGAIAIQKSGGPIQASLAAQ